MAVPMRMIVVVGMPALLRRLKHLLYPVVMNVLALEHLLHRQIVLNQHAGRTEGRLEMQIPDHPTNPGRLLRLPNRHQKTGLGALFDDICLRLRGMDTIAMMERLADIKTKIRAIGSLPRQRRRANLWRSTGNGTISRSAGTAAIFAVINCMAKTGSNAAPGADFRLAHR